MTAAPEPSSVPLLELRDVDAGYGPFRSIFGVSLAVPAGGVLALLGSNGSGKTTIARVCSGLIVPTEGQVLLDGLRSHRTAGLPVRAARHRARARRAIGVRDALGIEENLELTFRRSRGRAGVRDALDQAYQLFPRLGERRAQTAGTLSGR